LTVLFAQYGVLIVVAIIFLGELGIPTLVPGEIALAIAGSQIIHSVPMLIVAAIAFGAVDIVATTTIHTAARTGGHKALLRVLQRVMCGSARHELIIERWRNRLGGRDAAVVFVTRLIPMFRLYASITTGLIRIRLRDFLTGAAPASLVWAAIPLSLGYIFRNRVQAMENNYAVMMRGVIAISILIIVLAIGAWLCKRNSLSASGLRRIRAVLGAAAVCGATARLALIAAGGGVGRPRFLTPPIPTISIWTCLLTAVACGLLWLVAHDVHQIRTGRARASRIGAASGAAWICMVVLVALFSSVIGVQPMTQ
jgi:membrane protein DedA with SNARE-associated domain